MEGEHMRLHFTKMEGLGNDYVYVNCFKEKVEHPSELAVRVSDRHFGIGSDGLILTSRRRWQVQDGYVQCGRHAE